MPVTIFSLNFSTVLYSTNNYGTGLDGDRRRVEVIIHVAHNFAKVVATVGDVLRLSC